jgi:hypothetical protein
MDIFSLLISTAFSHPEFMKDLFFFFLAWLLLKKGVEKNFSKITEAIEKLTSTMASLEKNHSERLTNLEIKVDKITNSKGE